ncbi:MAG: hypothetical protein KF729_27410 [Sandaracinaceae bacterium]|nr:hypothetical protein [Sandaracinaceae bacterium]
MRALASGLAVAALVSLAHARASADRVPPPPADCPRGSVGQTSHAGPYCAPTSCEGGRGCERGQRCEEIALCIARERYTPHSRLAGDAPRATYRDVARGPCVDGACPRGGTCRRAPRCVSGGGARSLSTGRPGEPMPGCRAGAGRAAPTAPLALVLFTLLARARRRAPRA